MYKVRHGLAPESVSDLFVRKGSARLLRNSDFDCHVSDVLPPPDSANTTLET